MANLVHFVKTDATTRTTTSAAPTWAELTDYTISWNDLTTAGFAAGDQVVILFGVKMWGSTANINTEIFGGIASTFAGAPNIGANGECYQRAEPIGTDTGDQFGPFVSGILTLATNDNIYFGGRTSSGTASYKEFVCVVLKIGGTNGLASTDYLHAAGTGSGGNAPTSYDNTGANTTTPAAGDWLLFAHTQFLVDSTTTDMLLAINDGTSDIAAVRTQGEDTSDVRLVGTMAYRAGLGSGVTVRCRYAAPSGDHDATDNAIFGLRLNAFADHWGSHTDPNITHSVVDTYAEFAGNGSYSLGNTGPFMAFGWPIHAITATAKRPYGRIQIANSDWPAAGANRQPVADNGTASFIAPFLFGYAASQSAGTLDLDFDCAEDANTGTTCDEAVAVAFSLVLASGDSTVVLDTGAGAVAGADASAATATTLDTGAATGASQDLLAATTVALDVGASTIAGADAAAATLVALDDGAITAAGESLGFIVDLDTGAVAVAGEDLAPLATVDLDTGAVAVLSEDVATNGTIELDVGASTVVGEDLTPLAEGAVVLDDGAIAVAGSDLDISVPATIELDAAGVTVAGVDAEAAVALLLDTGAAFIAAEDLAPLLAVELDTGSATVAGEDATAAILAALDTGAIAALADDLATLATVGLDVGTGAVAGDDLAVFAAFTVELDSGGITVAGDDLTPLVPSTLELDAGALVAAGTDLALDLATPLDVGGLAAAGSDLDGGHVTVALEQGATTIVGEEIQPRGPGDVLLLSGSIEAQALDDPSWALEFGMDDGAIGVAGTLLTFRSTVARPGRAALAAGAHPARAAGGDRQVRYGRHHPVRAA